MKRWNLVTVAAVAVLAAGCGTKAPVESAVESTVTTYPNVKLVQWSDFHSSIYEADKGGFALGGLPVFMAAVEAVRGDGLSIVVDGGDMFQGAMPFNDAKGLGMIEVMNALKIDVASLGNHEFDYGPGTRYPDIARGALYEALERSQFPWVTANVEKTADNDEHWPPKNMSPYVIFNKGPYRVAVVGLLATETPIATKAANVEGLTFASPAETLRKIVPEIVEQKPDFVIVNAHITGLPVPLPERGETVINATFDGEVGEILALPDDILSHIDVILTGHSHKSFIAHQGDLTVVQTLSAGQELTEMTLYGDANGLHIDRESVKKHYLSHAPIDAACGEKPAELTKMKVGDLEITPSALGREIVEKYEQQMSEDRCEVMGCTTEEIMRSYTGECALGDMVTDAMRAYYPEAEIAVQNAGGLRIELPKGNIYRETLNSLMPFDNYAYFIEIPGADLVRILKVSSSLEHGAMQVSGMTYTIENDCKNPEDLTQDGKIDAWENNCLCADIRVDGKPLEPERMYKVVISDFLFKGGDALGGMFDRAKVIDKGPVIKKTIYDYVKAQKACFSRNSLVSKDAPRIINGQCGGKYY